MDMINDQNKRARVIVGLNEEINSRCFDQAIIRAHHRLITNIILKIQQDQYDVLIPMLCGNFNFVSSLEINLNNFALNFDNLPRKEDVNSVKNLVVRKNKFLFYPLVTMAENLLYLQLYFKELTPEPQDLRPLIHLKELELICISDSTKYF